MHELKIESRYFREILMGVKTFEIRENDRGFLQGDTVILKEWHPGMTIYTGRQIQATVGYISNYEQKGNYVVFSLLNITVKEI